MNTSLVKCTLAAATLLAAGLISASANAQTLKIGIIAPLTGPAAPGAWR